MSAISAFRIKKHLNIDPFWLATGKDTTNGEQPFSKISAETISLARQINQLPKQQRDFIHRIVSVMRF